LVRAVKTKKRHKIRRRVHATKKNDTYIRIDEGKGGERGAKAGT